MGAPSCPAGGSAKEAADGKRGSPAAAPPTLPKPPTPPPPPPPPPPTAAAAAEPPSASGSSRPPLPLPRPARRRSLWRASLRRHVFCALFAAPRVRGVGESAGAACLSRLRFRAEQVNAPVKLRQRVQLQAPAATTRRRRQCRSAICKAAAVACHDGCVASPPAPPARARSDAPLAEAVQLLAAWRIHHLGCVEVRGAQPGTCHRGHGQASEQTKV